MLGSKRLAVIAGCGGARPAGGARVTFSARGAVTLRVRPDAILTDVGALPARGMHVPPGASSAACVRHVPSSSQWIYYKDAPDRRRGDLRSRPYVTGAGIVYNSGTCSLRTHRRISRGRLSRLYDLTGVCAWTGRCTMYGERARPGCEPPCRGAPSAPPPRPDHCEGPRRPSAVVWARGRVSRSTGALWMGRHAHAHALGYSIYTAVLRSPRMVGAFDAPTGH